MRIAVLVESELQSGLVNLNDVCTEIFAIASSARVGATPSTVSRIIGSVTQGKVVVVLRHRKAEVIGVSETTRVHESAARVGTREEESRGRIDICSVEVVGVR